MIKDNLTIEPVDEGQQSLSMSPVFPLPIFMLCGGVQRLRIFEQKYIDMVANCHQTQGFVIALPADIKSSEVSQWGAHVQIVDFDKSDDNILMIDVQANSLVKLSDIKRESNGLLTAQISPLTHWSSEYADQGTDIAYLADSEYLSSMLKNLFSENNELNRLYKSFYFESPQWVCARLLEIAPIPLSEKVKFIEEADFAALLKFLRSICES